ncbi:MAG: BlaI/MecI/CopY family transcriptional regulator [Lysobacterales bacterium]
MIKISDAEMQVMGVLWNSSPLTAAEAAEILEPQTGWHRKTVNTLISRLVKKQALSFVDDRLGKQYSPLIAREDYGQAAANQLVSQLFGGRVAPLVAHFAEEQSLSKDDINELKAILKELSDD